MDGADVCRTSSRASRRPPDVISTVAILDPRWRGRKWRHPGPGARFSTPIVAVAQDGGPSASGRHLGWPHLREPEMRSSKMAAGSGRAAILRHSHNRGRKTRPILLVKIQNDRSNWKLISKGVPQGSILGPLLFNIFVNDMFLFTEHCNWYNYADDNSMSASAESIDEAMALLEAECEKVGLHQMVWKQILESSNLWSSLHMTWPIKSQNYLLMVFC